MKILSIIIPMYNVASFLDRCLGSVFNQKLEDENALEVIIVDDGSTDDSLEVAKKLTGSRKNVSILSQENKGLGGARNTGIKAANGHYLLFLDSDDYYIKDRLRDLIDKLSAIDVDVLEFGALGITASNKITFDTQFKDSDIQSGVDYYNSVPSMNSACNKVYTRKFLIDNNLFFKERIYIEDYEFNTRILLKAAKVASTSLSLACFYINDVSITRSRNPINRKKIRLDLINVMKEVKNQMRFYNDEKSLQFLCQRLTYLNVTLFYQLVKDRAPFTEYTDVKSSLINLELFYNDTPLAEMQKNLFRIVFLKHFWLFRGLSALKRLL